MNNEIIVTVVITSYNYGGYIRDALDGVLSQRVNFNYEILINDDASTDNSVAILKEYQSKYPDKFNVIYQKENQYSKGIRPWFNILFPLAQGKYIALCEGDDYWTDPLKLQKQVDFLEANKEYALCFHNSEVINERYNNKPKRYLLVNETNKTKYTTSDILQQWFIPTASIVFRKAMFTLPKWFLNMASGDMVLVFLLSLKGPLYYMDETMAIYRLHKKGISATHTNFKKVMDMAFMYKTFDLYTDHQFSAQIKKAFEQECQTHIINKVKKDYKIELTNQLQLAFINDTSNNLKKLDGLISLKNLFKLILFKMNKKISKA